MGEKPSNNQSIVYTEKEQELAESSRKHYKAGDIEKALQDLYELSKLRPNDMRILSNIQLCQFRKAGFEQCDEFDSNMKQLNSVCLKESGYDQKTLVKKFPVFLYNKAVTVFRQKKYADSLLILENLLELFEEDVESDSTSLSQEFQLKILHLAADAHLAQRDPMTALTVLENMSSIVNGADNWSPELQKTWRTRINACYCRAYLYPCCIGEERPKQPSSKDIKTLTKSSTNLSIFAKAAFEINRGNDIKAMKILNSEPIVESRQESSELGESCKTMYFNNLGIIYHRMHKHLLAAGTFQKALEEHDEIFCKHQLPYLNGRPSTDLRARLVMNIAVTKLYHGKSEEAFGLLLKASETLYDQPSVWYRLAECCIAYKHESAKEEEKVITEIGEGCARLAIANHKQQTIELDEPDTNPRLSYCYAYKCLHNALSYSPSMKTPGMSQEEVKAMQRMNSMIYVTLGFVCLRLGKYSETVNFTNKSLEKYPEHGYNYFANMYKGEALMELNEITEACKVYKQAISHAQDALKWMNMDLSWSQNPMNMTCPTSVQQAKVLASSNLAAAYCVNGDYNRACDQLAKVREAVPPELISHKTVLLAVYILLKKGDRQKALNILRTVTVNCPGIGSLSPNSFFAFRLLKSMNKDKPSTSKASDHETLVNPPAKRRRPDARMSKINVEFGQSSDEPFDFFDPRSAEVWNAPLPPRNPPVFDSRSTMTNDFDSIFSEIMESTTKPSIQTSNAGDLADLDELIQNMPTNEEGKFFYPELPPDLPTNPDEILLPEDEDDDEELTPTSPMKIRPSKNNLSNTVIDLAPVSEKSNRKKIDSLLEHNLLLQKPLEKFVNDLKRRITYLKTQKLIIRAEIDEKHDRLHRRSRGLENGETLSSFQKPYFFDRIQTASPYNDPDNPNDNLFLEKMKFCEDFVMNQMDYEMSPRQEQMLKNLIRQEVEAKLKNEINESLMSDERRWWERLMNKFEKKENEDREVEEVESEADKIREQSKEKLKSKIETMKEQGENIVGNKVEVDWMLIACKLNTLALQCNVKMTSKRITHLTSRERLQYGANGVHPFQAYIQWDRKLHPDLRKKKLTAKEIKLIKEMREEDLSWIEIAKKLSKPDARVTSMAVFKAFRLEEVKKEKSKKPISNEDHLS